MKTTAPHLIARAGLTVLLAVGPIGRSSALIAAPMPPPATRVLTASIPAIGLTHLDLTALDGNANIVASPDPSVSAVTVTVSLDPPRLKNFRYPAAADIAQVALVTTIDKNVVHLSLSNAREGNIEADWTIVVPARFSARIDAHDGTVSVTGIEGGVEAGVNAGLGGRRAQLIVDVPRGRLSLDVAVGDLTARRKSSAFDRAEVSATVGDAALFLLGHEIKAPHEPGPGHRVTLDGDGPDVIKARVSVGNVSVHIG